LIRLHKVNEVYLRVECSFEQALELKEFLSCYAPNFQFHPKFRQKIWNGKISFFDFRTQCLPIGLLEKFIEFSNNFGYDYEYSFPIEELFDSKFSIDKLNIFFMKIFSGVKINDKLLYPRDYQIKAIQNCLYRQRGVIESPTGSGKSLDIYSIIRYILENTEEKILLVVPSVSLVEQMFSDFFDYGWKNANNYVDILYSGKMITGKRVLCSTWQSIYKKSSGFFKDFGAILIDEVHSVGSSQSIQSVAKKCTNAKYRLGFTGTLPEEDHDIFNIYGYLGPQIFELKSAELIDKGVLSKIVIANILFKYPEAIVKKNKNRTYPEEIRTIETYKPRFKVLKYIFENIKDGENTLILCRHIDHLKEIIDYLEKNVDDKFKLSVIYGAIGPEEREGIRKMMNIEKNIILIGTYATMSTGINIRRIHNVIFASSYKSKIKILQSIGRGLRTHEDKDLLILWDIVDDLTWKKRTGKLGKNYVYEHFEQRLKYYEQQGFKYHNLLLGEE